MELQVVDATSESFAKFGQIGLTTGKEPTAQLPGMDFWADIMALPTSGAEIGIGVATQAPRPLSQDQVERHINTSELLVPAGGEMVLVLGPAEHMNEPEKLPELAHFAAFRVPANIPVLLHPGVWHWAPFAVDKTITLTVAFTAGTSANDAYVKDLPEALTFTL